MMCAWKKHFLPDFSMQYICLGVYFKILYHRKSTVNKFLAEKKLCKYSVIKQIKVGLCIFLYP